MFTPSVGVNMEVRELDRGAFQPAVPCVDCKAKWEESGIRRAIQNVKWESVHCRKNVQYLV